MADSKKIDNEINEASHRIRLLEAENRRAIKRVLETKRKISEINKTRERYMDEKEEKKKKKREKK